MGSIIGWIVALVALVRFLPSVNEEVGLQITSLAKGLVALWAIKSLALWFLPSVNEGVGLQMMICCTENNCTSWLHCGSACDSKGYLHLQMSWDIGHKTFDLPSFVLFLTSVGLSLLATGREVCKHRKTFPFHYKTNVLTQLWYVVNIIRFIWSCILSTP